jgi:hypothetical protein
MSLRSRYFFKDNQFCSEPFVKERLGTLHFSPLNMFRHPQPVELNASDARNKRLLQETVRLGRVLPQTFLPFCQRLLLTAFTFNSPFSSRLDPCWATAP